MITIQDLAAASPWALSRAALDTLIGRAQRAESLTPRTPTPTARRRGAGVAVIPIYGVIEHRSSFLLDLFGGTSIEDLRSQLRQASADPQVSAIVLDIDSPGGGVAGVTELAAEIRRARIGKRIVAVANTTAASAAYWLGAQADELLVAPSGQVGSVGVYAVHVDASRAYDAAGLTPTVIASSSTKVEGNEFEPLSDDARAEMQSRVDAFYSAFVVDVARGRRVTEAVVRARYGDGRMLLARDALRAGMVDGIGILDDAIRSAARPMALSAASAFDAEKIRSLSSAELERFRAAVHEAGHCAMQAFTEGPFPNSVRITQHAGGVTAYPYDDARYRPEQQIAVSLAGIEAETYLGLPNPGERGCESDWSEAQEVSKRWDGGTVGATWQAGRQLAAQAMRRGVGAAIPSLAAAIQRRGFLTGDELRRAIDAAMATGYASLRTPEQTRLHEDRERRYEAMAPLRQRIYDRMVAAGVGKAMDARAAWQEAQQQAMAYLTDGKEPRIPSAYPKASTAPAIGVDIAKGERT